VKGVSGLNCYLCGGRAVRLATAPRHATGVPRRVKVEAEAETKEEHAARRVNMYIGDLDEVGWLLKCGEGEERPASG